jgi:Uncharacterised nucleotidyltransferase
MLQNPHGERSGANACGAQGTCASFDVDHLIQSVGSRSCDDMPRLNTMLRPEHELLLCCGSPATSPAAERRLHELVQSRIEWSDVFRSAGRHGVAPLLHRALASDPRSSIPASLYDAFERHVIACGMQSRLLMRRSADTLRLFEKDGLRALVFKGGILAKLAYGDVALASSRIWIFSCTATITTGPARFLSGMGIGSTRIMVGRARTWATHSCPSTCISA